MAAPVVLPLASCKDRALVGGKAFGLAQLLHHGFRVPSGLCLTTVAYEVALERLPVDHSGVWHRLRQARPEERARLLVEIASNFSALTLPAAIQSALVSAMEQGGLQHHRSWAVRSSATNEDAQLQSMAGRYETKLGVTRAELPAAIVTCWASLWRSPGIDAMLQAEETGSPPKMAVVIQPMIDPLAAGVAFSSNPVTDAADCVIVNAVPGLAAALVAGTIRPDEWVVRHEASASRWTIEGRTIAHKERRWAVGSAGMASLSIPEGREREPALSDDRVLDLARMTKQVEAALGFSVDLEWALDESGWWLLQARPMTPGVSRPNESRMEWSRANFKETLPELPSPMALSFLQHYMEHNLLSHYRTLGCAIPTGWLSVRIVQGRPFINVTLFQWLVAQLGSDPALVTEQMGGEGTVPEDLPPRMSLGRFLRAGIMAWRSMHTALRHAPAWFDEMKHMANRPPMVGVEGDPVVGLLEENRLLDERVSQHDQTFAIAVGVAQGLDHVGRMLSNWFPEDWRTLLNAALQGQGSVISAAQILWMADLGEAARIEPAARAFFSREPWQPHRYRSALSGTRFLPEWDRFMEAYGQRAIGESDISVPRHLERPEPLLGVIRGHVLADTNASSAEVVARQRTMREQALARIRRRVRWWPGAWLLFGWQYRRLCRFLALREANRHHLMYFLVAVRQRLLAIGRILVERHCLDAPEDVFYLTMQDMQTIGQEPTRDWRPLVRMRHEEEQRHAQSRVPDFLSARVRQPHHSGQDDRSCRHGLCGMPISPGVAEGPVCLVRDVSDLSKIRPGVILVVSVIDPGLAPYFSLIGGLVAELGGTLSHGAIIAREYGVPAVANVGQVMAMLEDGEWVVLDGMKGTLQIVRDLTDGSRIV